MLTWYQDGYGWFGNDDEALVPHDTYEEIDSRLSGFLKEIEQKGAPYSVMRYIYHGSDNEMPSDSICDIAIKWNEAHGDVKIVVGTNKMFFEALERDIAENNIKIPTLHGDMPHTDYATLSLTDASTTSKNNRTKEKALTLEMLSSLVGNYDSRLFGKIYSDIILYDEHCFGMSRPLGSENEYNRLMKIKYAYEADNLCTHIEDNIKQENSDNWFVPGPGKYVCEYFTNEYKEPYMLGSDVLLQFDEVKNPLIPVENAPDLYGMTTPSQKLYRCTACVNADSLGIFPFENPVTFAGGDKIIRGNGLIENDFYRIEYGNDGIKSIYDIKENVFVAENGLGNILSRNIEDNSVKSENFTGFEISSTGPVADRLLFFGNAPGAPEIVTEVTIFHTLKRIDFAYRIVLDRMPFKEIYVSFPFTGENPVCEYGGTDCTLKLFEDTVPGGNTNQISACRFASVSSSGHKTILAFSGSSTVLFGGLNPTCVSQAHHMLNPEGFCDAFITENDVISSEICSMLAYNNCRTNFAVTQSGEILVKYSITSGAVTDVNQETFALSSVQNPMPVGCADCKCNISLGGDSEFLRIISVKLAEKACASGVCYIMRIRNFSGEKHIAKINWSGKNIKNIYLCNMTEDIISEIDSIDEIDEFDEKRICILPYDMVTVLVVI